MCTSFSSESLNYKFKLIKFYNIIYTVNEIRLDLKLKNIYVNNLKTN